MPAYAMLRHFCRILTMVCWYWTNCTFGIYPSSGVSKNWGIKISQYTCPKLTQGSITNHRATYLVAHTHKPLKQVRHQWQKMTQPLHTSHLLKPWKHKYRIQTKVSDLLQGFMCLCTQVSGSVVSNWPLCEFWTCVLWFLVYIFLFLNFLRHQTMDKVQKYNSFKVFWW
jgi:hypothetical protein